MVDNPIYVTQENITEGAVDVEHSDSVLLHCANVEESGGKEELIDEEVLYEDHANLRENEYDIAAVYPLEIEKLFEDVN